MKAILCDFCGTTMPDIEESANVFTVMVFGRADKNGKANPVNLGPDDACLNCASEIITALNIQKRRSKKGSR